MTKTNWQANGSTKHFVADFGLVDAKGRSIGAIVFVERNIRNNCGTTIDEGTFGTRVQAMRDGRVFGASAARFGEYATIELAKAAAEAKAERSRKAQAKKYGATVEESKAKQAAELERSMQIHRARLAETDAWLAARKAEQAAKAQPAVEAAPVVEAVEAVEAAPVAKVSKLDAAHAFVEAEAARVLGRLRHVEPVVEAAPVAVPVDADVARFRGYRDPDGALRFRKVEPEAARLGATLLDGRFLPWPAWLVVDGRRMTADEERQLWHELDASDPALAKARRAELVAWHDTVRGGPYTEPSSDAIARAERLAGA